MVSALDPRSSGPGSGPGRGHCVVFFTLTVPLSTQVYEWVPENLMLGVTLQWASAPVAQLIEHTGVEILLVASCYSNRG